MTWGDVTMAGIGTATSVCGDRVVGFGHPMNWTGDTTLGLHPADAIYVQEDLVAGFKVANPATRSAPSPTTGCPASPARSARCPTPPTLGRSDPR